MRVLIVEDEPLIADLIAGVLEAESSDVVHVVTSSAEAMRLAESLHPDLALIDIGLGGDMDGWAVAASLRDRFGTQPMFITGLAREETDARAARLGAAGCLHKPFGTADLVKMVEQARANGADRRR
jgi:DNA-binding response OmpR family regulator